MFNRRKPEDQDDATAAVSVIQPAPAATPVQTNAGKTGDTGLGVPPFRPAPGPGPHPGPNKDETMARSPFSTTPPPAPSPLPSPAGIPAAPAASGPAASPGGFGRPTGAPAGIGARSAPRDQGERRTLVVGRGISVQGSVQDAERLVVEGTVEASNIHAAELAINGGGVFKGEIEVEDAEIAGTIDGTLTVRGSLIVRATGRVLGTARCRRLQVEDGGQITGRIEMLTGSEAADPHRPSADRIEAPRPPENASLSA